MPKGVYNREKSKPQPRRKFFIEKKELYKLYILQKKGTVEIGKELKCTAQAVMYWLKKFNIPMRSIKEANRTDRKRASTSKAKKVFNFTKDILFKEYVIEKKTPNQIASEIGCSWDVVRRNLLKHGFRLPQHSKGERGRRSSTEYRKFQKEALRKYGYKCEICGYNKFVNVCHIKPRFKGGSDKVKNAVVLCPNHHAEFDYGMIQVNKRKSDTLSN